MKNEIIDLWKIAFPSDSNAFIDRFFEQFYSDENTLVIRENGQVAAMLQLLPYQLLYCGTKVEGRYLCGAATHPRQRGKGYMTRLMEEAKHYMECKGVAVCTLVPATEALFTFYQKRGYVKAFDYQLQCIQRTENGIGDGKKLGEEEIIVEVDQVKFEELFQFFDQQQHQADCTLLLQPEQLQFAIQDCIDEHGAVAVYIENQTINGLAIAFPTTHDEALVKAILYTNQNVKNKLVQHCLVTLDKHIANVKLPPQTLHSINYGMAQVIDKKLLQQLFQHQYHITNNQLLDQQLLLYPQRKAWMNLIPD
jgi:predicted acetyltransferase